MMLSLETIRVGCLSNGQFKGISYAFFEGFVYPLYDVEGGEGSCLPCQSVAAAPTKWTEKPITKGAAARRRAVVEGKTGRGKYLVCAITVTLG
ncbi:hypothetical protein [Bradyrhizobium ganzhouense]|uniref:hypothetical protein n=1 Tax=Bradyrhizobium ganzhouense TaxID=1179767 RepID=UPI003CEB4027